MLNAGLPSSVHPPSQKLEVQLLTCGRPGFGGTIPHTTHTPIGVRPPRLTHSRSLPARPKSNGPAALRVAGPFAFERRGAGQSSSLLLELVLAVFFFTTSTSLGCDTVIVRSTEMISSNSEVGVVAVMRPMRSSGS